jgi:hypothetical protein
MSHIPASLSSLLSTYACHSRAVVNRYRGVELLSRHTAVISGTGSSETVLDTGGAVWNITLNAEPIRDRAAAFDLSLRFTLVQGHAEEIGVGIQLEFSNWNTERYVLMPAAVYNGNRFESRPIPYPPILTDPADIGPNVPTIVSDIPRLNLHPGPSRIQQLTRDLATPAVGFQDGGAALGFWLLTEQATRLGDSGIDIEESADRRQAVISLTAPGVRLGERYTIANMHHPCADRGADFATGDSVDLRLRLYFFPAPRVQDLFDTFAKIRADFAGDKELHHHIPFSSAWEIQEEKYNRDNWEETHGYYAVGIRDEFIYSHWQTGWVGGLMVTYPMLAGGSPLSRRRALRNFDFVFPAGQDASGFFHGCGKDGQWFGDNFRDTSLPWVLVRKNSDALYFLVKQWMLLEKQSGEAIPTHWLAGTRRCADAFVHLWDRWGQFGQFVDTRSGDIIVGGSASAASAPAGLALAARFFNQPEYLRVAEASAQFFYAQFVTRGYTTGGPGEILQCPDSESAFGLLESFVVLYEVTGAAHWLEKACEQARQCFSWCVSYDFKFPPQTTFGRLDMRTLGSVYANVQNKHSAPGICTFSGDSLFKLFRATADPLYLELIREMAHNLPQYLSRADRPVGGMPPGWMNERVEMSDWLEPVGEIFSGSCWCEVSNMLAYMEIPGLYVQTDTGLICTIDHIEAEWAVNTPRRKVLRLTNPTALPARVKILAETSQAARQPLGQNALWGCRQAALEPEETVQLDLMA